MKRAHLVVRRGRGFMEARFFMVYRGTRVMGEHLSGSPGVSSSEPVTGKLPR
jgi:hypothetical protein